MRRRLPAAGGHVMVPRRDRYGEPVEDDDDPPAHSSPRSCWRCGAPIADGLPVPVCDTCTAKTAERIAARERRGRLSRKPDARPDTGALRRRARRDAHEAGALPPKPRWRPWWEQMP
jgi:hypothetical protein